MTRLFALSDTHGRPWPTVPACDAILFAGDLVDGATADAHERGGADALAAAWRQRLAGLPVELDLSRVIAVRGNHDVADPAGFFSTADDLSAGRLRRVADGLWVGGTGWNGGRYFDLPTESDLRERADLLRRAWRRQGMPGDRLVLLTHYPPALSPLPTLPLAGCHYGCLAALVREFRPRVVVAGHLHEWAGTVSPLQYDDGESILVMPGPGGALIEIADDGTVMVE